MHTLDFKPSGATPKAQIYPHYKDYNDKKFDTRNQDGKGALHTQGLLKQARKISQRHR